jgi:hypothetical protein
MEYIFKHELLHKDEIARKINQKNSFSPQKPLKRLQQRRGTQNPISRLKKHNNSYVPSTQTPSLHAFSPPITKIFEISESKMQEILPPFSKPENSREKKTPKGIPALPLLSTITTKGYRALYLKEHRRVSHSLITYIPSIPFTNH